MKRLLLAAALAAAPLPALAQQQPPQYSPAMLAGSLATNLSMAVAENDALKAQVAKLTKELDAAKAKPTPVASSPPATATVP